MSLIHSTAIINSSAKIHESANIGPYCVIEENVKIEKNVILQSNVVVSGKTTIGEGTKVWPFTVLGGDPQDLKYDGEDGSLVIGKNNTENKTGNPKPPFLMIDPRGAPTKKRIKQAMARLILRCHSIRCLLIIIF